MFEGIVNTPLLENRHVEDVQKELPTLLREM